MIQQLETPTSVEVAAEPEQRVHVVIDIRPDRATIDYLGSKEGLDETLLTMKRLPSVSRPEIDAVVRVFFGGFILIGLIVHWTNPPPQPRSLPSAPQTYFP